jgi:hypothetical protein
MRFSTRQDADGLVDRISCPRRITEPLEGKFSMSGSTNVVFSPGQVYRRRDLHEKFGGQRQGGISTPEKAPFIFLITGDSGKRHGYSRRMDG